MWVNFLTSSRLFQMFIWKTSTSQKSWLPFTYDSGTFSLNLEVRWDCINIHVFPLLSPVTPFCERWSPPYLTSYIECFPDELMGSACLAASTPSAFSLSISVLMWCTLDPDICLWPWSVRPRKQVVHILVRKTDRAFL